MSTEPLSNSTQNPDVNAARRSLLRGSLAAPVVMTIAPGAAMAQAQGSIYQCVQDASEVPSTAKEAQELTDSFYRVPATAAKTAGDNNLYIFQMNGTYYQINYSTGDVGLAPSPLPNLTGSTKQFYVIQRFDDKGNPLGAPSQINVKENGWASWPACYTSLTAGVHR